MEIATHGFSDLFEQLGLASDNASISRFCGSHKIADGIALSDAEFWTPQQAQFLRESWHQDSNWAILIDQLNASLRKSS